MTGVLDHVSIQCTDLVASAAFYDVVLEPLGGLRIMDFGNAIGYGVPPRPDFWIGAQATGDGFRESHVAFTAPSRAAVRAFFDVAVAEGATVLHAPRLWPEYHETYFGAFVRDPDGNNIEAVCHLPELPVSKTPRASGRCLCGAVSFQVFGELRNVINCHCHRCRRFTGHHMAATAAAVADLVVTDEDSDLSWFFPVPEAGYAFCRKCGSSLFWQSRLTPDRISICAGTLDPPTRLKTVQAWWAGEASDYHARPVLQEFETE
jgi:catechol 2,3-dioxygenase-like lactoylglutathione lyase family enzyme